MQSEPIHSRILPKRGGYFCCPSCGKVLMRAIGATVAADVPLYCKKCRREIIVDVYRGQASVKCEP